MNKLYEIFKCPPDEFRGQPFWSWNAKLEKEELANQIRDMKENGMGGFFMHSREGLETEYLGEEWMECIKESVKTAKEEGLKAWLYDEDRWPSGNAGGIVVEKGGDKFKSKVLVLNTSDAYEPDPDVVAVFSVKLNGDDVSDIRRLSVEKSVIAEESKVILFFRREICLEELCFNGNSAVDNLNPEALALFIKETHEKYYEAVGDEFGKAIPGIFSDETNIAPGSIKSENPPRSWAEGFDKRRVPWTDGFDDYFKSKKGYSFLDVVPYLFFDGELSRKTRHDYWMTVADRFVESFTKQISEWCDSHGIALTGHYGENDMGLYTWAGGTAMGHYRYQHVPGIDVLCDRTAENLGVKQCTSVANQFGRKRVISETYGAAGWEFNCEGQKWVGDWQYAMGVNLRCQHMAMYSIKGCRKRDCPQFFGPYVPSWEYNKVVEDYFARIGALLTQGERICDILVLHPLTTAWSRLNDRTIRSVDRWSNEFNDLVRDIMGMHYDFDLGDETIIRDYGSIENSSFQVNKAVYKLVVIPPVDTILKSTADLLEEYLNSGGRIIMIGESPYMIEGQSDDRAAKLLQHENVTHIPGKGRLEQALESVLPRTVSITDSSERQDYSLIHMEREFENYRILFVANNDRNNSHSVKIKLGYTGKVEEWDALKEQRSEIAVDLVNDGSEITFNTKFGPADSKLYIIDLNSKPITNIEKTIPVKEKSWYIGPSCKFKRTWPNALTIDFCSYRIGNDSWSAEMEIWRAQKQIRERLGMRQVYYNMHAVQRYKWINEPHPLDDTYVEFRFGFEVRDVPQSQVYLVVEDLEKYRFTVNGEKVTTIKDGWYMEKSFGRLPLPKLKEGVNEIIMSCSYTETMEVEDCFLIGDFGVDINRNITREPEKLHFGDWCLQGYMHYSGGIVYFDEIDTSDNVKDKDNVANSKGWDNSSMLKKECTQGRRYILTLGDHSAVTVDIRVNGQNAGHIPWRSANGLDITPFIKEGKNRIEIEVVGGPRNLLGPLHRAAGFEPFTESFSFRRVGNEFTPDYVLQPYGLFGQIRIDCLV